jgi:hypothetical protein
VVIFLVLTPRADRGTVAYAEFAINDVYVLLVRTSAIGEPLYTLSIRNNDPDRDRLNKVPEKGTADS